MRLSQYDKIRKTLDFLRAQPEVEQCKIEHACEFHVKFTDGMVEHWKFRAHGRHTKFRLHEIPDDGGYPFGSEWPEIRHQFTRNPLYPEEYELTEPLFMVRPSYLKKYRFCNVRIFIHRLAQKLAGEGWVDLRYPQKEIDRLLRSCRSTQPVTNGKIYIQTRHQAVRAMPISLHFANVNEMTNGLFPKEWTTMNLVNAIDKVFYIGADITRWSIFRIIRKSCCWVHLGYPISLSNLMKDLGLTHLDDRTGLPWVKSAALISGVEEGGDVLATRDPRDLNSGHRIKLFFGKLEGHEPYIFRSTIPTTAHDCFVTVVK